MTIDPFAVYDWVLKGGLGAAVGLFIFLLYTRRLRWSAELDEIKVAHQVIVDILAKRIVELTEERNEFKKLVISSQQMASKSVDMLSEVAPKKR